MVEIMSILHQYVPKIEFTEECFISSICETIQVPNVFIHPIIIGGDQLTAARGRGAKKAKVHADSPTSRLEGLVPVAEDWHTKVTLLGVRHNRIWSIKVAFIKLLIGNMEAFLLHILIRRPWYTLSAEKQIESHKCCERPQE